MTNPHRRTQTVVGEITVWIDGMGNPYRFTREDGTEVECICQPGIRCEYHMREKARPGDGSNDGIRHGPPHPPGGGPL